MWLSCNDSQKLALGKILANDQREEDGPLASCNSFYYTGVVTLFKGTVARDFLASIFFMDLLYMGLIFRG